MTIKTRSESVHVTVQEINWVVGVFPTADKEMDHGGVVDVTWWGGKTRDGLREIARLGCLDWIFISVFCDVMCLHKRIRETFEERRQNINTKNMLQKLSRTMINLKDKGFFVWNFWTTSNQFLKLLKTFQTTRFLNVNNCGENMAGRTKFTNFFSNVVKAAY